MKRFIAFILVVVMLTMSLSASALGLVGDLFGDLGDVTDDIIGDFGDITDELSDEFGDIWGEFSDVWNMFEGVAVESMGELTDIYYDFAELLGGSETFEEIKELYVRVCDEMGIDSEELYQLIIEYALDHDIDEDVLIEFAEGMLIVLCAEEDEDFATALEVYFMLVDCFEYYEIIDELSAENALDELRDEIE